MPDITLVAETGRPTGSSSSGRLRASGRIPGVVYGHGTEPTPVSVEARALRTALTTESGLNALLTLELGSGNRQLAMAREIQRHPVRGTVTHVDFLIVRRDEIVTVDVNINLVGEAIELHRADGVIDQQLFSLTVKAKPADLPPILEVDISGIGIGDSIRVADVVLADGVAIDHDPEAVIVVGQPPQQAEEAEAVAAGEEGATDAEGAATTEGESGGSEGSTGGESAEG